MHDFADNFRIMGKVEPYSCWDGGEEFQNVSNGGEEFEDILSALDFPMESLEDDGLVEDWDVSKLDFPPFDDMLPPTIAHNKVEFGSIDSTPETKHILPQEQGSFHTQSPVSVLESSVSKNSITKSHTGKRPRSKRPRPSGPSPWLCTSSLPFPTSTKNHNNSMTKNKERKIPFPEVSHRPVVTKKCTHCEVTKTPQWREGPLGPKTLCNACGVRYRSGRLLPEYRPAASPTFVPTLHSNSHKKVIEMRKGNKGKQNQLRKAEELSVSPQMEFVPMSSYFV